MEFLFLDDGKHLGGVAHWSMGRKHLVTLTLSWDPMGIRCGDLKIPCVPSCCITPAGITYLREALEDADRVLFEWCSGGVKPEVRYQQ